MAGMGVWAVVCRGRRREPDGIAAELFPSAGDCGMGAGPMAGKVGQPDCCRGVDRAWELAIPLSQTRDATQAGAVAQTGMGQTNAAVTNGAELVWQPYSEQALDAARAAGHPVFIDFTAAWCFSCQVNERLVLKSADVESASARAQLCAAEGGLDQRAIRRLQRSWLLWDGRAYRRMWCIQRQQVAWRMCFRSC